MELKTCKTSFTDAKKGLRARFLHGLKGNLNVKEERWLKKKKNQSRFERSSLTDQKRGGTFHRNGVNKQKVTNLLRPAESSAGKRMVVFITPTFFLTEQSRSLGYLNLKFCSFLSIPQTFLDL